MISRNSLGEYYSISELGDVVEFLDNLRRPVTESDRRVGPFPYYGANGKQGTIDDYIFDEPLVLLAEDGGHFDNPERGIAYRIEGKTWVNNHAHVLRPKQNLDIGFLCRVLENYNVKPFVTGTTRGKLTKAGASEIPIPVPPLHEQRRIAAILDQADTLRAKRREALAQLDSLTQSIFVEMFGDPITNPKGWPRKKIANIGKVITGNTPPRANPDNYGDAIEWIKSDNINTPHYYLTPAEERLSEIGKSISRKVPAGSILITCIAGSPDCIGNAAMTDREVAFNQQINAFIPENGDVHFYYAQIIVGKRLIQEASTAGMKGMVSKGRFEQIELIVPPTDLQHEFARRVSAVLNLTLSQRTSLNDLDNLMSSLQHRAFRGEL